MSTRSSTPRTRVSSAAAAWMAPFIAPRVRGCSRSVADSAAARLGRSDSRADTAFPRAGSSTRWGRSGAAAAPAKRHCWRRATATRWRWPARATSGALRSRRFPAACTAFRFPAPVASRSTRSRARWRRRDDRSACSSSPSTRRFTANTSGCSPPATRERALGGQRAEDTAREGLVVLEVVREQAELLHLDEIEHAEGFAEPHGLERQALKTRSPALRPLRDQDEVQRGPVSPHHVEQRAITALVLDGDELLRGWAILHADEILMLVTVFRFLRDAKVRREILAAEPKGRVIVSEGRDVVPR